MTRLSFTKMHGIGNDFIVIDDRAKPVDQHAPLNPELARKLCDRRFGIGADQVLWIKDPQDSASADARMEILNSDGSTAEMCGNGIRAVALFMQKHGSQAGRVTYVIETLGGLKKVEIQGNQVAVDMGEPVVGPDFGSDPGEALSTAQGDFYFQEVVVGNPHAVIFADDVQKVALSEIGPLIEKHERFPQRINVEFVQVKSPGEILVRVWERGAGITLACGSGACASAVAAIGTGRTRSPVQVHLPGGTLTIRWAGPGEPIIMEGPAEEVFSGEYILGSGN